MSTPLFKAPRQLQADPGFPPSTPVAAMTPEQQAAYWRHEAKKQQARLRAVLAAFSTLRAAFDDVAPDLDALQGRKTA